MSNSLLLYDDDCGICTVFAQGISRLFAIHTISMNDQKIMNSGLKAIGEDDYWRSFHVVVGNRWTTEKNAVIELFKILPFGSITNKVIQIPFLMKFTMFVLKYMQNTRNTECKI